MLIQPGGAFSLLSGKSIILHKCHLEHADNKRELMSGAYFQKLVSDPKWTSEERAFIQAACGPTPFIVELLDSELSADRLAEIRKWCIQKYGEPSDPFRGRAGEWRTCAITARKTICFHLEEQLTDFLNYRTRYH